MTKRKLTQEEFTEKMQAVLEELNNRGDFHTGTDHDKDETFTIVESWEAWYIWITNVAIYSGNYRHYQKAIKHRTNNPALPTWNQIKYGWTIKEDGGLKKIKLLDDTRLGRQGLFPMDDNAMFLEPGDMEVYMAWADELVGQWGFSDEYDTCSACGKVIQTGPDSYSWTPDWIDTPWDSRIHVDCVDLDVVLEMYRNKAKKALPDVFADRLLAWDRLVKLDHDFENGFHQGMNDDPKKIRDFFKQHDIDIWFTYQSSQFYTTFQVLVQPEDEERANDLIDNVDAYQGYDNATELGKALKGEHSDHFTVTTYEVSPEDFVAGNLPHPEVDDADEDEE